MILQDGSREGEDEDSVVGLVGFAKIFLHRSLPLAAHFPATLQTGVHPP